MKTFRAIMTSTVWFVENLLNSLASTDPHIHSRANKRKQHRLTPPISNKTREARRRSVGTKGLAFLSLASVASDTITRGEGGAYMHRRSCSNICRSSPLPLETSLVSKETLVRHLAMYSRWRSVTYVPLSPNFSFIPTLPSILFHFQQFPFNDLSNFHETILYNYFIYLFDLIIF